MLNTEGTDNDSDDKSRVMKRKAVLARRRLKQKDLFRAVGRMSRVDNVVELLKSVPDESSAPEQEKISQRLFEAVDLQAFLQDITEKQGRLLKGKRKKSTQNKGLSLIILQMTCSLYLLRKDSLDMSFARTLVPKYSKKIQR